MSQPTWIRRHERQTTRQRFYWLIVSDEDGWAEALTTRLSDGTQTLPVFSFREEAEMFLCLRGLKGSWRIREARSEKLLSILRTTLQDIELVALDPIPEISGSAMFELLSLDRGTFMKGLARGANGSTSEPCRALLSPALSGCWRTTESGYSR